MLVFGEFLPYQSYYYGPGYRLHQGGEQEEEKCHVSEHVPNTSMLFVVIVFEVELDPVEENFLYSKEDFPY